MLSPQQLLCSTTKQLVGYASTNDLGGNSEDAAAPTTSADENSLPRTQEGGLCPDCGQPATEWPCPFCGGAGATARADQNPAPAELRLPDGTAVGLWPDLDVLIGREAEPPIGPALARTQSVSRRHCELRLVSDGLSIRDLASMNGTTVHGQCLRGQQLTVSLADAVVIQLAREVRIVVQARGLVESA